MLNQFCNHTYNLRSKMRACVERKNRHEFYKFEMKMLNFVDEKQLSCSLVRDVQWGGRKVLNSFPKHC